MRRTLNGIVAVTEKALAKARGWTMVDKRYEELKRVPPLPPFSDWPEGVRGISIGETDGLGVSESGELYWRGKPVEIRRPLYLSGWQKFGAFLVAIFTVIGATGSVIQGWTAYNDWACKVHWAAVCPSIAPSNQTTR